MSNDYQAIKKVLLAERQRRATFYRYRPAERGAMDKEVADALAALDRMKKASEWKQVGSWWTDKFD